MNTIEQRLEIYRRLLSESLSPSTVMIDKRPRSTKEFGFCWMYRMLYGEETLYYSFEKTLPELYEKATVECAYSMWNNWDEREDALTRCIQELQTSGGIV